MTTQTETTTSSSKPRGFRGVPCLKCHETDVVRMCLDDVTTFVCSACEEEFTADDVEQIVSTWSRVLAWIQTAPVTE